MQATRLAAIGLSLLVLGLAAPVQADHGTTETEPYLGPAVLVFEEDVEVGDEQLGAHHETNVGGASFAIDHADRVHVAVDDELGAPTPALLQFFDAQDRGEGTEVFCGETDLAIPEDAARFDVWVGPVNGVVGAPLFGAQPPPECPWPATRGTITATWG